MKILYYNWVDYLDPEKRGGGVTVYQRNLIEALGDTGEHEVTFLSSGISADVLKSKPRWDKVRYGKRSERKRRYEIVNSGTLSPSHFSFGNVSQVSEPETEVVFFDFIRAHGPFDVIHFNNLEGLPADVLKVKEHWPDTKVVLSLHNYYPFCPQVNLWRKEKENCLDFRDGKRCVTCLPWEQDERGIALANSVAYVLKKWGMAPGGGFLFDQAFKRFFFPARVGRKLTGYYRRDQEKLSTKTAKRKVLPGPLEPIGPPLSETFADRRRQFVELINSHCDKVLCVSERVKEVAQHHGLNESILETCYIGTRQAGKFAETTPKDSILPADGILTLGYMGYMRRDKGFYFLLKALEALPPEMAARIRLIVCAKKDTKKLMDRLASLQNTLAAVLYADGYTHDELDDIIAQMDVGLVPVLWEDNLPQVAIEMHARHIPLLTSDLGGAQELGNFPDMVFKAGDVAAFHTRLAALLNGEITQAEYWENPMAPLSMEQHIDNLLGHYQAA